MERGCIGEGRHGGMDWEESGMEGWMERKEEWIDWKGIGEGWIGEERGMAMTMAMFDFALGSELRQILRGARISADSVVAEAAEEQVLKLTRMGRLARTPRSSDRARRCSIGTAP